MSGALDCTLGYARLPPAASPTCTRLFRLISAVVLLPVCTQFEKLACRLIKDDEQVGESVDRELQQLDEKFFASPALALASANDAISTMARLARNAGVISTRWICCSITTSARSMEIINENEDHIDSGWPTTVDNYLIRLSSHVNADGTTIMIC